MDEAMNLNGMGIEPVTADSNANSVVEIKEEGAIEQAVVSEPVYPVQNPAPAVAPEVPAPASITASPSDQVPVITPDSVESAAIIVETPVMVATDNGLPMPSEKVTIDGPLGPTQVDAVDLGMVKTVEEPNPQVAEPNTMEAAPETPILNEIPVEVSSEVAESPVEAASLFSMPTAEAVSSPSEMEEVAAMGKELFENAGANANKSENLFSNMDFGPLKKYIDEDDITDISYSNGGQLWLKSLSRGVYRAQEQNINDALVEKIAFQCSNVMGKTFNMAHPFLDSESSELRMNFVHDSIARNGIAAVFRKTPARIRLEKEKILGEKYITLSIHDFLIKAVQGHSNIIVAGETGSGKTELVKYLASHTSFNEKLITIEDTLELHLDRIFPERDIVAMKTNNIASYSDVLVTCMRQNPKWILLSEVRSAEAVTAVRNSISSGHNILSTIHADKAENIPQRMYSLLESNIDVEQFLAMIYRYVHLGVYVRGRFDPAEGRFVREIGEVTEFYVDENNNPVSNTIYRKTVAGLETYHNISDHLLEYLEGQGVEIADLKNFAPSNNSGTGEELSDLAIASASDPNFTQVAIDKINQ